MVPDRTGSEEDGAAPERVAGEDDLPRPPCGRLDRTDPNDQSDHGRTGGKKERGEPKGMGQQFGTVCEWIVGFAGNGKKHIGLLKKQADVGPSLDHIVMLHA